MTEDEYDALFKGLFKLENVADDAELIVLTKQEAKAVAKWIQICKAT